MQVKSFNLTIKSCHCMISSKDVLGQLHDTMSVRTTLLISFDTQC